MGFSVRAEKHLQKLRPEMPQSMRDQIIAEATRMATEDVFGVNVTYDRHGKPVESGIGAPGNPHNHISHYQALEKYEGKVAADAARERDAKLKK
jgi:hypothetical protein